MLRPYTKSFLKNTFNSIDNICEILNIQKKTLGIYISFFHIFIITKMHYELYYTDPYTNNLFIYWYYFLQGVILSNIIMNGCILVKLERHLFKDKKYLGPHNIIIYPFLRLFGITDYDTIKIIQVRFAMIAFIYALYVSHLKYTDYISNGS